MSKRNVAFGNNIGDDDIEITVERAPEREAEKTGAEENEKARDVIPEINILGRSPGETREEALKNEISDFAKERPEAVAALIKSILRGEN